MVIIAFLISSFLFVPSSSLAARARLACDAWLKQVTFTGLPAIGSEEWASLAQELQSVEPGYAVLKTAKYFSESERAALWALLPKGASVDVEKGRYTLGDKPKKKSIDARLKAKLEVLSEWVGSLLKTSIYWKMAAQNGHVLDKFTDELRVSSSVESEYFKVSEWHIDGVALGALLALKELGPRIKEKGFPINCFGCETDSSEVGKHLEKNPSPTIEVNTGDLLIFTGDEIGWKGGVWADPGLKPTIHASPESTKDRLLYIHRYIVRIN